MDRIRVRGRAAFQSTPAEYMRDMLRYDDGRIEAIWDYPSQFILCDWHNDGLGWDECTFGQEASCQVVKARSAPGTQFTAIVHLNSYTPDRWRSFGLATDVLGDVGEYSCPGYTVDEWLEEWRQERPSTRGQALAGGVAVVAFSTDGRVPKARGCE